MLWVFLLISYLDDWVNLFYDGTHIQHHSKLAVLTCEDVTSDLVLMPLALVWNTDQLQFVPFQFSQNTSADQNAIWDIVGRTPPLDNACIVTLFFCNQYEQVCLIGSEPCWHRSKSTLSSLFTMTFSWLSMSQVILLFVLHSYVYILSILTSIKGKDVIKPYGWMKSTGFHHSA